jgi:butyryl-CoA dehydrogenase
MFYTKEQRHIISQLSFGQENYHELLEQMGNFFEHEIEPMAKVIDQQELFPKQNLEKLAVHRIMALPFSPEHGGRGLPLPVYITTLEMLAKACANTAIPLSIQCMSCEGIRLFGNADQKKEFLMKRGLIEGNNLIAFALTEICCGSDAKAIQTKAVRSGTHYVLNGDKMLISNPGEASVILIFASTDKGISSFLVPQETPGFKVTAIFPKLGLRGNKLSAIHLEQCIVPLENRLGEEGKGMEYAKHILNYGRLSIAAIGIGIAQAAFEKSLSYSRKRKTFGKSIGDFELVQEKIANMATEIQAARLLTNHTAALRDKGEDIACEAAQAKLFSSEMAQRVCDAAIQIHGGYGYIDEYDIHRHWRDARMLSIVEGTSEVLRLLIAHQVLKRG